MAPSLSLTLSGKDSHDRSNDGFSAAALSTTPDETPSLDINLEALETPSGSETGTLPDSVHELEWEGETGRQTVFVVALHVCVFCAQQLTVLSLMWLDLFLTDVFVEITVFGS